MAFRHVSMYKRMFAAIRVDGAVNTIAYTAALIDTLVSLLPGGRTVDWLYYRRQSSKPAKLKGHQLFHIEIFCVGLFLQAFTIRGALNLLNPFPLTFYLLGMRGARTAQQKEAVTRQIVPEYGWEVC
eukprot:scaffold292755_cov37-Prasinocladus_malaysianus.AAC.1